MLTCWTQHIKDPKAKTNFESLVKSSIPVLERLQELIKQEMEGLDKAETGYKIYDLPNWDYRQAHSNGFRAGLSFINKLINLDQQKDTQ